MVSYWLATSPNGRPYQLELTVLVYTVSLVENSRILQPAAIDCHRVISRNFYLEFSQVAACPRLGKYTFYHWVVPMSVAEKLTNAAISQMGWKQYVGSFFCSLISMRLITYFQWYLSHYLTCQIIMKICTDMIRNKNNFLIKSWNNTITSNGLIIENMDLSHFHLAAWINTEYFLKSSGIFRQCLCYDNTAIF